MKNMMNTSKIWEILEIEPTDSKKEIRRAYAACLKKYHPEEEPEKFQMVKDAYEQAIESLKNQQEHAVVDFENDSKSTEESMSENQIDELSAIGRITAGFPTRLENQMNDMEIEPENSLLDELSQIMEQTVYKDPLAEKMMQKVMELFDNPNTREDGKAWANFFLEWEFLDVQLNMGFAQALAEYLKAQEYIPEPLLMELMIAYDLDVKYNYLLTLDVQEDGKENIIAHKTKVLIALDVQEDGEIKPLLKGARRIIALLWNEQEEEKRSKLWEEREKKEHAYRAADFHEYLKLRYLFENGLLVEGQEKLWEQSLWQGKPENTVAWRDEEEAIDEEHLPELYAYLVNRFEIPEFVCCYFYGEYELYFLDGCKWEKWYTPLRDEVLRRYPELEEKQFGELQKEYGQQNLSIDEQKTMMTLISPFTGEDKKMQKKAYQQIVKLLQEKQKEGDFSYHFYLFSYCISRMSKNEFENTGFEYIIKIVVHLKSYLFALPHMEYPEEVRSCFFESLWRLTYYFEENKRKKKFEFYGQDEFLLHCESTRIPAVFSVWDFDYMPYGICSHCGKTHGKTSFEEGKKKLKKREIVEEWDLYEVAKSLTKKSKKNFDIYKKISKLYQYRTCEHCGEEETFIDSYMNWWYENTRWKRPDKEILQWIFKKAQEIEKNYAGNSQRERYYKIIIDYLYESKDWDKKSVVDYFREMQLSYKFEEEQKERVYYLGKTKELLEQVLMEEALTKEETERFSLMKADIIYDDIGNQRIPFEEAEREWDFVIEVYDSLCGPGNIKSIRVNEKKAFSLAYNQNQKYDPKRAIDILKDQLELLQKKHPEEAEEVSRIQETLAFIYRDKIKDYSQAAAHYEQYLKYIEDTYGKEDEYSRGERRIYDEICQRRRKC